MKLLVVVVMACLFSACAFSPPAPKGALDVMDRPAEKALLTGLRAYDDARYVEAEKQLSFALKSGLVSARDVVAANKHLAFIYCTTNRIVDCEASFRSARRADPSFTLSKSETGHPLWGPVYRRTLR